MKMTDEMLIRYAVRGVEETLLDWGEKKKAVLCLKKEDTEENRANNDMVDQMAAGIDQEMEALKAELDGLKEKV